MIKNAVDMGETVAESLKKPYNRRILAILNCDRPIKSKQLDGRVRIETEKQNLVCSFDKV